MEWAVLLYVVLPCVNRPYAVQTILAVRVRVALGWEPSAASDGRDCPSYLGSLPVAETAPMVENGVGGRYRSLAGRWWNGARN